MNDALQDFLDETSPQPLRLKRGGCGGWCIQWNVRKTGRTVQMPKFASRAEIDAADVQALAADYASRLGLVRNEIAERGDTGVFDVDESFEPGAGRHVVGICIDGELWAFKGMHGITIKRATPIEVWG